MMHTYTIRASAEDIDKVTSAQAALQSGEAVMAAQLIHDEELGGRYAATLVRIAENNITANVAAAAEALDGARWYIVLVHENHATVVGDDTIWGGIDRPRDIMAEHGSVPESLRS
jgi:hypothetical protein